MSRRWVFALGVAGLATALAAATLAAPTTVHRRAGTVPSADAVVATVPVRDASERRTRAAAAGGELSAAVAVARGAIERARTASDPRFLGEAQATLAPWWNAADPPTEILLLRATIKQALHDFAGARVDLDHLVARRGDDAQARLTRAVVATVTGDRATAAADCAVVTRVAGELWGAACAAPLAARGDGPRARARLAQALATAREPAAIAWGATALAELDRALGDDGRAELALRTALAADPDDRYTRAALVDVLLDAGRVADALAIAADHPGEALALLRAIALDRSGADGAAAARRDLAARFAAAAARGDELHLRERARFELELAHDATAAVATATRNWALQRETADAHVLLAAAVAAGDRGAAAPVLAWLDEHGIDDVRLRRLAAAVEVTP